MSQLSRTLMAACLAPNDCAIVRQLGSSWQAHPREGTTVSTYTSAVKPSSADFLANRAAMEALVADLRAKVAQAALGGGPAALGRHLALRKLLSRQPVN